jgi:PAS domain S-box-containing protein
MADHKLKILHVEDSPSDAGLIHRELRKGGIEFEILVVENEKGFTSGLTEFSPHIILSDHSLPSFNSLAALKIVRDYQLQIPFILITATTSEEIVVTIMKEGAWDYILKDRLQRLPNAVKQAMEKYNSQLAKRSAEIELASAHQKLLFHIENSPLGFIEWDEQFKVKSWSQRAEDIFGWTEIEIFQKESFDSSAEYPVNQSWISKIADDLNSDNRERTQVINESKTKDARLIWCEWHISVQKDEYGKITTLMALVSDITERKKEQEYLEKLVSERTQDLKAVNDHLHASNEELQAAIEGLVVAEARLKSTSEEFKDLYNNAPCGYLSLNEDGFFVEVNDTFLEWLGYTREEMINVLRISDLLTDAGRADFEKRFPVFKKQGHLIDVKSNFIRKNGSILSTMINSSSVFDNNGKYVKSRTSVFDITRIKQIERELKIAKSIAEAANQTKSQFLANMSHEIRTPLNAVLGLTHLALKTELTAKQSDYLKKIHSSSDSLLSIINDILDFSKIESGKLKLEEVTFDLEEVFQKLADVITYKAETKGLEIVFGIDSKVPKYLIGDPSSLGQILSNLCSNAIKFTDRGEVVVDVSMLEISGERIKLNFTVTDTGIGMDEAQMSRLFQPFMQADNSISRKYGGTGLGLSIIKRLVELMNGDVSVKSEPGQGSVFSFTIWLKIQKQQRKIPMPSVDPRKLNVMVVEDNKSSMKILREMLESFSFNVITMDSSLKAIHFLKNNFHIQPVQLVLMDAKLPPGVDGLEAVSIIRADAQLAGIKIIMMCNNNRHEMLYQKAEELELSGILVKPIRYSEAYDSIMNAIENNVRIKDERRHDVNGNGELQKLNQGHVLLVEDNEINQQVATELLIGFGFTVEVAENGLEAVNKFLEPASVEKYNLVLMDLQMPVMGGIKATQEIRKNDALRNLPIIAMTADAIMGVKENCLAAGMMDFISKPINPEHMLTTIEKWLKPSKSVTGTVSPFGKTIQKTIPPIEGIDLQDGLHHVGNNATLYYNLLIKFLKNYENFIPELFKKFQSGEQEEGRRMLHTLKGMSGNLGIIRLHEKCAAAEASLRNGSTVDEIVSVLDAEMNKVLEGLRQNLVIDNETVPEILVQELTQVKPLLDQLATLLRENDPEATKVLKQIGMIKGYESQMLEVEKNLQKYDFDKALVIFKEIESQLK